jgi:hypothetical protein
MELVKMRVEAKQKQDQTKGRASQAAAWSANLCGPRMSPEWSQIWLLVKSGFHMWKNFSKNYVQFGYMLSKNVC